MLKTIMMVLLPQLAWAFSSSLAATPSVQTSDLFECGDCQWMVGQGCVCPPTAPPTAPPTESPTQSPTRFVLTASMTLQAAKASHQTFTWPNANIGSGSTQPVDPDEPGGCATWAYTVASVIAGRCAVKGDTPYRALSWAMPALCDLQNDGCAGGQADYGFNWVKSYGITAYTNMESYSVQQDRSTYCYTPYKYITDCLVDSVQSPGGLDGLFEGLKGGPVSVGMTETQALMLFLDDTPNQVYTGTPSAQNGVSGFYANLIGFGYDGATGKHYWTLRTSIVDDDGPVTFKLDMASTSYIRSTTYPEIKLGA